jgi:hypothetical protein
VFTLTDGRCDELIKFYDEAKAKDKDQLHARVDVIGKCWTILTSTLSDELFLKTSHVGKGKINSLISEIRASLSVSTIDDIQPLRVELYSASMRDCDNDLQTYVSFIISKREKLSFLQCAVPEEEIIHLFIKGLSPVFQPIQVHFAIPGTMPTKFDQVVSIVRRFSTNPAVAAELSKSKNAESVLQLLISRKLEDLLQIVH